MSESRLTVCQQTFIGMGSNLDNPPAQLWSALQLLEQLPQAGVINCSSLYRSTALRLPGDERPQADYANAVLQLETAIEPLELLKTLKTIEVAQGRDLQASRWSARVLDLDLLCMGQQLLDDPVLQLPHPQLVKRNFVVQPLLELQPEFVLATADGPIKLSSLEVAQDATGLQRLGPLSANMRGW